ncbi:NAD-dependent epimerase/dehydratase [Oleiphilus messinensis]|uniref:NAD-dependent epimerase/dehydratase n=1 Tax=Oleiphilus messinensis TaxID=141451 RepID=A0A1Y0IGD7_9GAMM|nr:NAD(P)-dependent oxidoreductase [Oleiphilus messinensis]ARU59561.1 NAD-dependent epimerase/dehydratase [Oleiphilus messinensis]
MNILITGANGFIGSHIKKHLGQKHRIYSIVKTTPEDPKDEEIILDLADVESVRCNVQKDGFADLPVDVIIHTAGVLCGANQTKDLSVFHRNNAITESLVCIAQTLNPEKVINLSTIGVYPNASGTYDEGSIIKPSMNAECLYSLSKFCSEELLYFFLKDKMQVVNLRLAQTYGEGMREDRIFSIMLRELLEENTITVFGAGQRESAFMSVEFLVLKIGEIINHRAQLSGTYNLSERNMTYSELARLIISEHGNAASRIRYNEKGVRSRVNINSEKLLTELNQYV